MCNMFHIINEKEIVQDYNYLLFLPVLNYNGIILLSVQSDHFYNAGRTKDIRDVINHLRNEYPEALLFLVGTSIGANIVVQYLIYFQFQPNGMIVTQNFNFDIRQFMFPIFLKSLILKYLRSPVLWVIPNFFLLQQIYLLIKRINQKYSF